MIELGMKQTLEIKRFTSVGAYLNTEDGFEDDILLPKKEITEDMEVGQKLDVFVYRDAEDRMITTTREPMITLGNMAKLRVIDITKIGAFLDWGLERDLFLPFKEQTIKLERGREYLVGLYIDKSDRLCATMKLRDFLSTESPYAKDDWVEGTIYGMNDEFGAFVAVDNKYEALIPKKDLLGVYTIGEEVEARVTNVKEDGKIDLSLRDKAYLEMIDDAKIIIEALEKNNGSLYLNDKSDPDKIREELSISKSAFKRAIGRLLKEGEIEFIDGGIKLI